MTQHSHPSLTSGRRLLRQFLSGLLCALGVAVPFTSTFATPLTESVTNLGSTSTGGYGVYLSNFTYGAFTTGSDATTLTDVTLNLNSISAMFTGNDPSATYQLTLWSDSAGRPGTQLFSIGSAAGPAADNSPVTFTDASHDVLAPATTYWLGLTFVGSDEDSAGWNTTGTNTVTGTAGWNIPSGGQVFGNFNPSTTPLLKVDAAPASVPEPTGMTLFGLATGVLALRRKRRA